MIYMVHPKLKTVYVGIDPHRRTHTASIINCFCEKLGEITFDNKPTAFEGFLNEVMKHVKKGQKAAFGLEDTGAAGRALAAFLISKKKIVKAVWKRHRKSEPEWYPEVSFSDIITGAIANPYVSWT